MRNSYEMRAIARECLRGQWGMAILILLLQGLIASAAANFGLSFLVTGVLSVGCAYAFTRCVRDRAQMEIKHLFYPLGDRVLGTAVLTGLLADLLIALAALLLIVPGVILSYSYRLVPYLVTERPELSVTDCLHESRRLMQGYKWRAFCLDLSFIGWILLSLLTCGIGMLFVTPYMQAASAVFAADRLSLGDDIAIDAEPASRV